MSKIKYLDFAKSVDASRENLKDILKNKGADVAENQSLQTYVNDVIQLPDKEPKPDYVPDPYFVAFDKYYETDPLLKKNGGQYAFAAYCVIYCAYDTSYLKFSTDKTNSAKIYTSDGQILSYPTTSSGTTRTVTITWDKTKDGQTTLFDIPDKLQNGSKVRWIRIYHDVAYDTAFPCYPTSSTSNESPLVYCLTYSNSVTTQLPAVSGVSGKDTTTLAYCKNLKYITLAAPDAEIIASEQKSSATLGYIQNCISLECINNLQEMKTLSSSVSATNLYSLKKINKPIYPSSQSIYPAAYFDIKINITDIWTGYYFTVAAMAKCKYLIFKSAITSNGLTIDATTGHLQVVEFQRTFDTYMDVKGTSLTNVTVPENFSPTSITLYDMPNLTKASVLQLMTNLKDLSSETARTLTLPMQIFTSLSDEEKAIAIDKNWTLSFK